MDYYEGESVTLEQRIKYAIVEYMIRRPQFFTTEDFVENEILYKNYRKVLPDDVVLMCYTSGTTDNPKGVMVSSRSLILTSNFMYNVGYHLTGEDKTLSFLPLGHLMEHMLFAVNVVFGVQIGYYSGNNNKLAEDAQELKPTIFCAVPRIYERIYQTIMDNINKKGIIYKKLFDKLLKEKGINK